MMKENIQELFQQYHEFFRNAMKGEVAMVQAVSFYATAVTGTAPAGVMVAMSRLDIKAGKSELRDKEQELMPIVAKKEEVVA